MVSMNTNMITVLISFVIIPTILSQCERKRIIQTIQYMDCQPKRVMSFECAGTCTSFSRPSPTMPGVLMRQCQCCQENDFITRRVRLLCPNTNAEIPFRFVTMSVSISVSCSCKSCSPALNEINLAEQINNGKRGDNRATEWNFTKY